MSKEQGDRLIDIIRWGQLFVEGKGKDENLKKLITETEADISRLYISIASEGIKRAIKEKMTDAIFYDSGHELYRLYHLKEITQEEYENNPVKKAHDEYAGEIKYRVGNLDIASVLWAITANNSVPDYKTALNAALDRAEQHIATICKETGCAADIAAFITRGLIERVCKIVFDVYHPKEFDELQSRIEQHTAQWSNLFEQLKDAKTVEEKDLFRTELDKAEKEFNDYCAAYNRKIDRAEGVDEITAAIIKRLFPNAPTPTDAIKKVPEAVVNTFYPANFVAPTDKVSNLAFSNELTGGHIQQLAMERRGSNKQITTLASIDFDNLNGSVQIKGRKELTPYDREVHDAIITLYVEGGNEYITPQMIYQVMTGNPNAYLEKKQAEAINESITKCMYSRIIIDASEEAKAYGFDSFKYDGSLISGERVTATLNGTVVECLRILRPPVLYEYANKKNQIGRFNIKLLNTPINKTKRIITLQGYLYRRILSMKNNSNLSKTIVYDTVYNQLDIKAASDGALRKKKAKLRDQIKTILDYWKKENFIAGYVENKRGQVIYSVTIRP